MSSSILEQIRINHELSELYESAICKELDQKPAGVGDYRLQYKLECLNFKFGTHSLYFPHLSKFYSAKSEDKSAT